MIKTMSQGVYMICIRFFGSFQKRSKAFDEKNKASQLLDQAEMVERVLEVLRL